MAKVYIIMGVSGSGKSTVGKLLADRRSLQFYDADDFHPKTNIQKMTAGKPLDDSDRWPWLEALAKEIKGWNDKEGAVLACSALKESYRNKLSEGNAVEWIVLNGSFDLIHRRLQQRSEHFMDAKMLRSQFDDLELPSYGHHISVANSPEEMVASIIASIHTTPRQIGIVGLGVMGSALARNLIDKKIRLSVYNRTTANEAEVVAKFMEQTNSEAVAGFTELEAFVHSLNTPRRILLMIPAGTAVDEVINSLAPYLSEGDSIMDGGNSHYSDTRRRFELLKTKKLHYFGIGISGGEKGALNGPSMMVGGPERPYQDLKVILETIAANDRNNRPCVSYLGPEGCGHYVKMIHNGIEYAEMQLLAETVALLKGTYPYDQISELFASWNATDLSGYLLEITAIILSVKEGDQYLLDTIVDKASGKGTGVWSSKSALDLGTPATLIHAAVESRFVSMLKEERTALTNNVEGDVRDIELDMEGLRNAYAFARLINHYQGFELIRRASDAYCWNLSLQEIARIWTNGCIIKSTLMESMEVYFSQTANLLESDAFTELLNDKESSIRTLCNYGIAKRIALPCFTAALNFWFAIKTNTSTANLIQAQRDYFGAHGYERTDGPAGQLFNFNWNA